MHARPDARASTADRRGEAVASDRLAGHRWELSLLLLAQTAGSFVIASISVVAPTIHAAMNMTDGTLQLIVSGYSLAFTSLLVTGARLGERRCRHMFVLGGVLFMLAGLTSGLAINPTMLVAGQIVLGIGAAMIVPQVLSIIQRRFSGSARTTAIGLYSVTLGLGVALGLVLSAILVLEDPFGLSWRLASLLNVPIGLVFMIGGRVLLRNDDGRDAKALDGIGAFLFTATMACVVVPLLFGPGQHWPGWTVATSGVGIMLLSVFVHHERKVAAREVQPLVDPGLLVEPGVPSGLFVVFVVMGGYGTLIYTLSSFMQSALHFDAVTTGLVFSVYAAAFALVNLLWERLPEYAHVWIAPCALFVLATAQFRLGWAMKYDGFSFERILPLLLLAGAGHGAGFGPLVSRLAARVPSSHRHSLSGLVNMVAQFGILTGIAAIGSAYVAAVAGADLQGHLDAVANVLFTLGGLSAVSIASSLIVISNRSWKRDDDR